jgi:hypothetical protein
VDSVSGRIYDGFGVAELPFKWLEKNGGEEMERREFHADSRLLKINVGSVPRVERTMVAITVDLKVKDLLLPPGTSLQCGTFMKFRGPTALD